MDTVATETETPKGVWLRGNIHGKAEKPQCAVAAPVNAQTPKAEVGSITPFSVSFWTVRVSTGQQKQSCHWGVEGSQAWEDSFGGRAGGLCCCC